MASDVQRWFDSEARQAEAIARAERDTLAAEVSALRAALERIAEMATDGQGHNLTRAAAMGLEGRGYTITAAKEYVREHHRHNRPPVGGLFATAVELDGEVVGVAVAGRPSARADDDSHTIDVGPVYCPTCKREYGNTEAEALREALRIAVEQGAHDPNCNHDIVACDCWLAAVRELVDLGGNDGP